MDKFRQGYEKIMDQVLQSLPQEEGTDTQESREAVLQAIRDMNMDYKYQIFINKETMLTEKIAIDVKMDLTFSENKEGKPEKVNMNMKTTGFYLLGDFGKEFAAPDVSQAQKMTSLDFSGEQETE